MRSREVIREVRENGESLIVTTNNRVRELVSYNDLPPEVRSDFPYMLDENNNQWEPAFVKYAGQWYDTNDVESLHSFTSSLRFDFRALGWSGIVSESFFSGLLFCNFDREGNYLGDGIIVGRYYS